MTKILREDFDLRDIQNGIHSSYKTKNMSFYNDIKNNYTEYISIHYQIQATEEYYNGESMLNNVTNAFNVINHRCSLLQDIQNSYGLEDINYNKYIFGTEGIKKENIFIRIWRTFVAAMKKIFGAIIKFFKTIIAKIVSFIKWLIGKFFKKKKSPAEVKRAASLFDRFKGVSFKNIKQNKGSEDYNDLIVETFDFSTEADENNENDIVKNALIGTGAVAVKEVEKAETKTGVNPKTMFSEAVLEDVAICRYDDETFMKLNRLIGITSSFVDGADKIMRQQIQLNKLIAFRPTEIDERNNSIVNASASNISYEKNSELENTTTLLSRIVRDYIKQINNIAAFPVYKNLMDNDDKITKMNGKLIAQACLCKNGIGGFGELEKLKNNFKVENITDLVSKEFFMKVYAMPDDYKKEWVHEEKEMTQSCQKLERTLEEYQKMVDGKSNEFEKLANQSDDSDYAKRAKEYFNIIRTQTRICADISMQVIQTTKYVFQFRINMSTIVEKLEYLFCHIKKEEIERANQGEIQTLYGPLKIGIADFHDSKFRSDMVKISKTCLTHLLGGEKIKNTKLNDEGIVFEIYNNYQGDGGQTTSTHDTPENDKMDSAIKIKFTNGWDSIVDSMVKRNGLPKEIVYAMNMVHETVHVAQTAKINKKTMVNTSKKDIGYSSKIAGKFKSSYYDYLGDGDSKKTEIAKDMINNTAYRGHLIEINANKIAFRFGMDAIKRLNKLDKSDLQVFEEQLKKVYIWSERVN